MSRLKAKMDELEDKAMPGTYDNRYLRSIIELTADAMRELHGHECLAETDKIIRGEYDADRIGRFHSSTDWDDVERRILEIYPILSVMEA